MTSFGRTRVARGPRYRRISTTLWTDERVLALSRPRPNAQTLWFFLLTGPCSRSIPGLIPVGPLALSEMLGWSVRALKRRFAELEALGMVKVDWPHRLIWMPNAVKHNPPDNPNVITSWRHILDETTACPLRTEALETLRLYCEGLGEGFQQAFTQAFQQPLEEPLPQPLPQPLPPTVRRNRSANPSGNRSGNGSANGCDIQKQEQEQDQDLRTKKNKLVRSSSSHTTSRNGGGGHGARGKPGPAKGLFFRGERIIIFKWMHERLGKLLGACAAEFELMGWYTTLDERYTAADLMLDRAEFVGWVEQETIAEAEQRGLRKSAGKAGREYVPWRCSHTPECTNQVTCAFVTAKAAEGVKH